MAQAVVRIGSLPDGALEAAREFHATVLPQAMAQMGPRPGSDLVLVFPAAPYDHRAWRAAAVQDLARVAAPVRVNALSGGDEEGVAEALAYLAAAPGVTGQLLAVDGKTGEIG